MSNFTDFVGGSGGGSADVQASVRTYYIQESCDFEFPFDGVVDIYCVGAGGSGASVFEATSRVKATGGGAGGTAVKRAVAVTKGDTLTCSLGVGGASVVSNFSNGVAGNATNVNSNDITISLTANGGSGGTASVYSAILGASGGTGSGGDENYTGGSSGGFVGNGTENQGYATGGGAVGLNRNGFSSGNIVVANNNNAGGATGGAGLGGSSGSINAINAGQSICVTGGGSGLAPTDNLENSTDQSSPSVNRASGSNIGNAEVLLDGFGGGAYSSNSSFTVRERMDNIAQHGAGGGGIGIALWLNTNTANLTLNEANKYADGGVFGGGGGAGAGNTNNNANRAPLKAGDGKLGGGGGGLGRGYSANSVYESRRQSGAGGDGVVVVQYTEVTR